MIPFGSQRASGQDLATHLMNAHDNEQVEVVSVRGAVARDLHGAFTEWEAIAHNLTRCQKYLYSLSINPDPRQGGLSPEQYEDYIARVEDKLGLTDQPRAVVFHTKNDRHHCHVVWSRIDVDNGKAVQISFDRQKLMDVTREFARDHGLKLPDGYYRDGIESQRGDQLSLYDKAQQENTGLTKQQRMAEVTAAWKQSDSAKAFVHALAERGYILAHGKRPYVLVDRYGEMNALSRLIDDKQVTTKHIRDFLEKDFPADRLPTVEQARARAARLEQVQDNLAQDPPQKEIGKDERRAQLKARQENRRAPQEQQHTALLARQAAKTLKLGARQQDEMRRLEGRFKDEMDRIGRQREQNRPTGLAAFLGRVTGMDFLIKAIRTQMDVRRQKKHEEEKAALAERHEAERQEQALQHRMQQLETIRRLKALDRIEARERQSLERQFVREDRARLRGDEGRSGHTSPQRKADRIRDRDKQQDKKRNRQAVRQGQENTPRDQRHLPNVLTDFAKAKEDERSGKGDEGGSDTGGTAGGDTGERSFKSVFGKNKRGHSYKASGRSKDKDVPERDGHDTPKKQKKRNRKPRKRKNNYDNSTKPPSPGKGKNNDPDRGR